MVTLSAEGSGTYNAARLAISQLKEEFGTAVPISLVDSKSFSIAYLHPVFDAVKLAGEGMGRSEIVRFLNEAYTRQKFLFTTFDLKYLQRGGRLNAPSRLVAQLLNIAPIMCFQDGLVSLKAKERGKNRALASMIQIMLGDFPEKKLHRVQLIHVNRQSDAEELQRLIDGTFEVAELLRLTMPEASVSAHIGNDLIGVAYS